MQTETPLHAIIMAGGVGARFWPASRRARPKQFLPFGGDEPLLAATVRRLVPLVPAERTWVVTGAEHAGLARELLPHLPFENVLAEPTGKNTLPCVALAAAAIAQRDPESVQAVLPADHVIAPPEAFRAGLETVARAAAQSSALYTFGVRPTEPATGYGYIKLGAEGADGLRAVERFVEKPDRPTAETFLADGGYLWNSGMFVWSGSAIRAALEEHAPATWAAVSDAPRGADLAHAYEDVEAISIDKGVLEKARDVRVLPVDYSWSDVGSWSALSEVHPSDATGNCVTGGTRLVAEDAEGCIVYGGEGQITALIGVRDLVVVHADGATLVLPKDRAQDVRKIVDRLRQESPERL